MKVTVRTGKTELIYEALGDMQHLPFSEFPSTSNSHLLVLLDNMSRNAVKMETKRINAKFTDK